MIWAVLLQLVYAIGLIVGLVLTYEAFANEKSPKYRRVVLVLGIAIAIFWPIAALVVLVGMIFELCSPRSDGVR